MVLDRIKLKKLLKLVITYWVKLLIFFHASIIPAFPG